jgi:hypothetical protein
MRMGCVDKISALADWKNMLYRQKYIGGKRQKIISAAILDSKL